MIDIVPVLISHNVQTTQGDRNVWEECIDIVPMQ